MDKNNIDFYNTSQKIVDLKVYYHIIYESETADEIDRFIDYLVKAHYTDKEIVFACDSLCRTITVPIEPIKYEMNEMEIERKYMCMYEPIMLDALTESETEQHGYDYKEEKNNKVVYGYNVPGIRIKCDKVWKNKEKKLYLRFYGENEILGVKNYFNRTINIDVDIYEKYDWTVKDGILYVTLFEKINECPDFHRVEKSKSTYKKKDAEATLTESETE